MSANHLVNKSNYKTMQNFNALDGLGAVVIAKKSMILESFHPLVSSKFNHPIFEGECYLKSQTEKFKAHWMALIGNELFWYKNNQKQSCILMQCLVCTYIHELKEEQV